MRALSIRQPWAELILRGVKTVEYRSRPTRVIGERFHIYAPLKHATPSAKVWSRDLAVGPEIRGQGSEVRSQRAEVRDQRSDGALWLTSDLRPLTSEDAPPEWLLELAEQLRLIEPGTPLPVGVIVGSAVIEKVSRVDSVYRWHLTGARRAKKLRKPDGHPQPGWFRPF
jgi:hypothetical protein